MTNYSFSRRRFLQASALFSASLVAPIAFNHLARAEDEVVDAIVIGSGFGGAVAALRLGQAGVQTIVLERGRRWTRIKQNDRDPDVFATFRNPDHRAAWFSDETVIGDIGINILKDGRQFAGVLEYKQEDGVGAYCGAGVGGGSLVYNCAHYQPAREQFYLSLPQEINYDEMDYKYYPLVRSIIDSSNIPEDVLNTDFYLQTRIFREQADNAGLPNRFLEMAVDWNRIREEIAGTRVQSGIIGEHWIGMNSGAKNSLDQNYLPKAEATGNVDILPLHEVTEIEEINDPSGTRYRITCNQIEEFSDLNGNKVIITTKSFVCKYLFLAAGSIGTSKLLVKTKAKGTLANLNDNIGKYWGNNGDSFGIRSGLGIITNSDQGGPINGAIIEHFDNPLGPVSLMGYPVWNAEEETLLSLGMSIAKPAGEFNYDPATDSVKLTWPENVQSDSVYPLDRDLLDIVNLTYKILDRSNTYYGRKLKTEIMPGPTQLKRKARFNRRERRAQREERLPEPSFGATAHPLGGAVLGKACDFYGRVKNYEGLYVVDGALIPGSTGCANPAFTIAALAERNMEKILNEDIV